MEFIKVYYKAWGDSDEVESLVLCECCFAESTRRTMLTNGLIVGTHEAEISSIIRGYRDLSGTTTCDLCDVEE